MNKGQAQGETQTREHRVGERLAAKHLGVDDLAGMYSGIDSIAVGTAKGKGYGSWANPGSC